MEQRAANSGGGIRGAGNKRRDTDKPYAGGTAVKTAAAAAAAGNNKRAAAAAPPNVTRKTVFKTSLLEVKKRYIWSDRETEHFIRLIIDMGMTNMLDSKRKRNSDLYSSLVAPMAAAGFNRDATQLRTKWKHLKQDYKMELLRIRTNGVASTRMSYFPLLHEVLKCKPSNAMAHLCEVVSDSVGLDASDSIANAEYDGYADGDVKMETADYYDVTEPQVDIIQTCDAETQTTATLEQQVLRRLQALENGIGALREEWRRDRATQRASLNGILDGQRLLMEEFVAQQQLAKKRYAEEK